MSPARVWPGRRRRGDERGAIAVFVASSVTVLVLVAAFAIDLGMQRVVRRDLQALVDVVALDLARELDGRTQAELAGPIAAAKSASVARNADVLGATPTVTATLGGWDGTTFDSSVDPPTAVRVEAEGVVDFAFVSGSGEASRSAIAASESAACFQLGSWAATVTPSASPVFGELLQPVLGSSTLQMAGYNGLATASLSLLDLISAPSIDVGTVDELLALDSLTAGDVFLAAAHVLTGQGRVAQADVLEAAAGRAVAAVQIDAGDLFALSTVSDAVLETQFNVMDIFLATVFLADGDNLGALHNLQAGVPSVGVTMNEVEVIERPQFACGDNEAHTAQLKVSAAAKVNLNAAPFDLGVPDLRLRLVDSGGSPTSELSMGLQVDLAGARGRLSDVECTPTERFTADIWSELSTVRLAGTMRLSGTLRTTVLGVSGVTIPIRVQVTVAADASEPAATLPTSVTMEFPPRTYGDHASVSDNAAILPHVSVAIVPGSLQTGPVSVLGVPVPSSDLDAIVAPVITTALTPLTQIVGGTANPLVDAVNEDLEAVTTALGINVAGADFYPLPTPTCAAPVLRG